MEDYCSKELFGEYALAFLKRPCNAPCVMMNKYNGNGG